MLLPTDCLNSEDKLNPTQRLSFPFTLCCMRLPGATQHTHLLTPTHDRQKWRLYQSPTWFYLGENGLRVISGSLGNSKAAAPLKGRPSLGDDSLKLHPRIYLLCMTCRLLNRWKNPHLGSPTSPSPTPGSQGVYCFCNPQEKFHVDFICFTFPRPVKPVYLLRLMTLQPCAEGEVLAAYKLLDSTRDQSVELHYGFQISRVPTGHCRVSPMYLDSLGNPNTGTGACELPATAHQSVSVFNTGGSIDQRYKNAMAGTWLNVQR